jgi:putative aldouronate transport system substrate-binding protein
MFKEAVTYAKKWYDEGIINKNAMAEIGTKLFESGKDFSQKNIDERIYEKTAFTDSSAKSAAVEVYPNKKFTRDSQMNNAIAINKNAANPERTLMFMNLISSNEAAYDALMYGIKDVTYSIDSNGQVGYASGESASKPLWQGWNGWGFYRANFAKPTISRPTAAIKQEETFVNRSNIVISPLAGFIPSSDAIKTQLAQRDQIQDEQGKLLLAGIVNGDITTAINEYIKRQKAAGLDQIISDTQSQVNKFLSSKKS